MFLMVCFMLFVQSVTIYMYGEEDGFGQNPIHGTHQNGGVLYCVDLDVNMYERIRREEALLVDFQEFLNNVVWLLEQSSTGVHARTMVNPCVLNDDDHHHHETQNHQIPYGLRKHKKEQYRAVIHTNTNNNGGLGAPMTLQFLESNAFRELVHLTLRVEPKSEKRMNSFLLYRLREVIDENVHLTRTVESLKADGDSMQSQMSLMHQQMSADSNTRSNEATHYKIQCDLLQSQLLSATEKHEYFKERVKTAEEAARAATTALEGKEGEMVRAQEEIKRLQAHIESYERRKVALEDLKAHGETELKRLKELCDGYKAASDMADARVEDWKRMAKRHEEEGEKKSQLIQNLEAKVWKVSEELSQANARHAHREEKLTQKMQLLETQETALREAQARVSDLQQQNRNLEQEISKNKSLLEQAQDSAQEAVKKAQSSEKMIVWLNKQLTSIQLKSGASPAPKHSPVKIITPMSVSSQAVTTKTPPIPAVTRDGAGSSKSRLAVAGT